MASPPAVDVSGSSPKLWSLPVELQEEIITHVARLPDRNDDQPLVSLDVHRLREGRDVLSLLNWSSSCKWFRMLLAPRCFETISLWNTKKSALAVQAVAQSEWSGSVRELRYVAQLKEGQESCSIEELHPPEISYVLRELSRFVNLEKLSVAFLIDYKGIWTALFNRQGRGLSHTDVDDDPEHAAYEENRYGWRALLSAGLHAIVQNSSYGCLSALEIHNLGLIPISVFDSQEFHNLLPQLKTFSLSFSELTNLFDCSYIVRTTERLGKWFFNNLSSVENLSIDAGRRVPLGAHNYFVNRQLSLREAGMPNLRSVKFQNVFICKELVVFLQNHIGTLQSITLEHCYATYAHQRHVRNTQWWRLFEGLIAKAPTRLVSFELIFAREEEGLIDWETDSPLPYDKEWYSRLRKSDVRQRNVFPYGMASKKSGLPYPSTESIQHSLHEGRDKSSYLSLMTIVESNARRR
ncbi:hypothetical protein PRK78_001712 [Emydomyces testavorans]|uniref:F-box domain-containing protein n=1 Tax=Emydomyces testavorans TaxID=2070801 RepID=A0AAF0DEG5_9EURO|nr:hypothetical protein PRK78_001712 [Emydomyces testavorans]